MGAPELPDFGQDDVRPIQSINHEVSSDESENEILMNTYYYQLLPMDDNNELPQSESHAFENNNTYYDGLPIITNRSTSMDNTLAELQDNYEEITQAQTDDANLPSIVRADIELERDVWNQPRPQELQIELDSTKTQQILTAMANINLSNITIPEWAIGVPDDHWKELLLQRIGQRKSTDHTDKIINVKNIEKEGLN